VAGIFRRVKRYWWVVVAVGTVGGGLSVAGALLRKPLYKSEAVLEHRELIRSEVLYGQDQQRDKGDISTRLQETVLSRTRLGEVIAEFELYKDIVYDRGSDAAVEEMRKQLEFKAKGGDVFYISFLGESKDQAHDVVQHIAETMIEQEALANAEQVTATKDFLEKELDQASKALNFANTAAIQFIEEHPEYAKDAYNMSTLGVGQRGKTETPVGQPVRKTSDAILNNLFREEARQKIRIRDLERKGARPELTREKERALDEVRAAEANLAKKRVDYTDQHPDVLQAQTRLNSQQRRLSRAKEAVRQDLQKTNAPQKVAADAELAKIQARIRDRKIQIAREKAGEKPKTPKPSQKEPDNEVTAVALETQWLQLLRDTRRAQERYDALQSKQFIADIDAKVEVNSRSPLALIDRAYRPNRPAGASRTLMVIAGGLISGLLGVGLALFLALIDDRLFNRREVEKLGILPVLVIVPRETKTRRRGKHTP